MLERTKQFLICFHLSIFLMELLVLISILRVNRDLRSKTDRSDVIMERNKRALPDSAAISNEFRSGSSRTCREIYNYWQSACLQKNNESEANFTAEEEINSVQRLINYFTSYSMSLKEPTSHLIQQSEQSNEIENNIAVNGTTDTTADLITANLTVEEKCRRLGLEGSLACQMEFEHPDIAEKVYNILRPVLTIYDQTSFNQLMSREAVSEDSPLIPVIQPAATRRKRRARFLSTSAALLRRNLAGRQQPEERVREKRALPSPTDVELCRTSKRYSALVRAPHAATGQIVTLYTFSGASKSVQDLHAQIFEVGECPNDEALSVVINSSKVPVCREARSRVLAYIVVRTANIAGGNFHRCSPINNTQNSVCRDWIHVVSHCKLFLSRPSATTSSTSRT